MCGLGLPAPSASPEPSSPPSHNLVKSANTKIIQSQGHQQQPSALHEEPKPSFGCGGVQWGEMAREASPQIHAQLQSQCSGCGQAARVTMNQTPPSLSSPSTNPSPKHTDDRWVWNTPIPGSAHRTRAGLLQEAAPWSSDTSTVAEVAKPEMCHRKGHAPPEE